MSCMHTFSLLLKSTCGGAGSGGGAGAGGDGSAPNSPGQMQPGGGVWGANAAAAAAALKALAPGATAAAAAAAGGSASTPVVSTARGLLSIATLHQPAYQALTTLNPEPTNPPPQWRLAPPAFDAVSKLSCLSSGNSDLDLEMALLELKVGGRRVQHLTTNRSPAATVLSDTCLKRPRLVPAKLPRR
jgi:hypothetical protein